MNQSIDTQALDALKYKEHLDYEIIQSTNPDFNKAVVRVNIFHDHRQTIQYIQPHDHEMLAQAELLIIDEAAAIPLPLVRKLLGPYLVFMASTINGYEGTGRSLSLKLLDQLRKKTAEQSGAAGGADWRTNQYMYKKSAAKDNPWADEKASESALPSGTGTGGTGASGRVLREIELETPIRYASGDPVEKWLYHVLCLDSAKLMYRLTSGTPHPMDCDLFAVDRDALFSHHSVSESFLQRLMALYVASHYKNSPNDLQLLSDAPAHRLFVLLGKKQAEESAAAGQLPDVLCIVQVALEGGIARKSIQAQLAQGNRAAGDLVPWMIAQQYQDFEFGKLEGARIVRIATHPDVSRMGYGKRAVELLTSFYQGSMTSLADSSTGGVALNFECGVTPVKVADMGDTPLKKQKTKPRADVHSLMVPIAELPPQRLNYISVSFGLTDSLFSFWNKTGMRPFYLRQTANDLTGEHR
jgi:N-acetyltransferase 10